MKEFTKELEELINKHSLENDSNTPDYILAEYLTLCLQAFNRTLQLREDWYGRTITNKNVSSSKEEKDLVKQKFSKTPPYLTMTVSEIKELKAKYDKQISDSIEEFHRLTGLNITRMVQEDFDPRDYSMAISNLIWK
jgi:transcription termination factor NusB